MTNQKIKEQADKIIKVTELKNIARILADKMINLQGYYTFNDHNGLKVYVEK